MFKKLLALSLSLILSAVLLLGAEVLAYRQWERQLLSRPPIYQTDPILGFRLKSNYRGIHQALGSHQPITIITTNQGFCDNQAYSLVKPPKTFRILVLGNSFVQGAEIPLSQTLVKQLQHQLNSQSAGLNFEVINAGWCGSSTLQHYLWLKTEGFALNPDLVILSFYAGNDINEASLFNINFDDQGLAQRLTLKDTYVDTADFPEPLWQLTQSHLLAIKDLTQAHGSKFLLSLTPAAQPDIHLHQKLVDFAASSNLAFVDLLPQFRQHQADKLYFSMIPTGLLPVIN